MSVFNPYKTLSSINTSLGFFIMLTLTVSSLARAESKPENTQGQLMHNQERLLACPSSPNCVNSQTPDDEKHFIKALQLKEPGIVTNKNKLLEVLNTLPRVKIVTINDNYIKAEFTSKVFSFVDDVEFVIAESHIDVRSASRTGHHDLGANRKRVEEIRDLLSK